LAWSEARGRFHSPVAWIVPLMASDPSNLQRKLRDEPGAVTHFLETLTGERLIAEVARQYSVTADARNDLGLIAGEQLTHRTAVLRGLTTNRPYLYAESTFVPERLPERARQQLAHTTDPIGRVLVAHGFGLVREPLPRPEVLGVHMPITGFDLGSEIVWSRAYRLMIDGFPAFAIREWFLRSVLDALDRQGQT
jgi:chorismate-pyruvate lyase